LLLLLSIGISAEFEYDVGVFTFSYDRVNGEVEHGFFFLLALAFGAPVAVLKRGDTVGCAI
jgi:hypothetical protein